jgi:hypothetical protein
MTSKEVITHCMQGLKKEEVIARKKETLKTIKEVFGATD